MSTFFWFRRDLRLTDNHGLFQALKNHTNVRLVFIFDSEILGKLSQNDARVSFIFQTIEQVKLELNQLGKDLEVYHGKPESIWSELLNSNPSPQLYTNTDYEPYAQTRDLRVAKLVEKVGGKMHLHQDQVLCGPTDVLKADGKPYTVFTPYFKRWLARIHQVGIENYPSEKFLRNLQPQPQPQVLISLKEMGFQKNYPLLPDLPAPQTISSYDQTRDIPSLANGTSRLGLYLRFGTVSVRQWTQTGLDHNQTFTSELAWREFYQQILWHFPHVVNQSFKPQYDQITWRDSAKDFQKWCEGKTGFPLVDAGMRQLNKTGYMHNRVRMLVASFLTKHLLLDWRLGEAYFAEKLLDFDLASNNGGWQWAAGSGCDAAPYFRVFNPLLQQQKFDPDFIYIRRWVPEFETDDYPQPMVHHPLARARALEVYKAGLSK